MYIYTYFIFELAVLHSILNGVVQRTTLYCEARETCGFQYKTQKILNSMFSRMLENCIECFYHALVEVEQHILSLRQ